MTDVEFARAFERGEVAPSAFGHHQHLRLAWVYLREAPSLDAAVARVRGGIQQFAAAAGASGKYHETITVLWMRLLDAARDACPAAVAFDDVLRERPELADKDLPLRYYTRDRLFAADARVGWVPPDLRDL
jgi:hypothetical protein